MAISLFPTGLHNLVRNGLPSKTKRIVRTVDQQRSHLEVIAKKLHITDHEEWYEMTTTKLRQNGGSALVAQHGSLSKMLTTVYPEYPIFPYWLDYFLMYNWDLSKFTHVPRKYWDDLSNQRSFIDQLAKKLNVTSLEDWYKVNYSTLQQHGASGLLALKYGYSFRKLLTKLYPQYPWDPTRFNRGQRAPRGRWSDPQQQREFMDNLAKQLHITSHEDWHKVTHDILRQHGATGLLNRYNGSFSKLLTTLYPEYKKACRDLIMSIVTELKLSKVQDVVDVPIEYPMCTMPFLPVLDI